MKFKTKNFITKSESNKLNHQIKTLKIKSFYFTHGKVETDEHEIKYSLFLLLIFFASLSLERGKKKPIKQIMFHSTFVLETGLSDCSD